MWKGHELSPIKKVLHIVRKSRNRSRQGAEAFLLGTGATIVEYLLYGGVSFGFTQGFKKKFVEHAGAGLAALYPIPILLGAR